MAGGNGKAWRVGLLLASFLLVAGVALALSPIAQVQSYHLFADRRALLGIPNFWNVVSNLPFLLVGLAGLAQLRSARRGGALPQLLDAMPYHVFFAGVVLVCLGSSWYHLAPDNMSLVWDRLPMTIAFMALVAAMVADRIDRGWGVRAVLPLLLAAGLGSVAWWAWSEAAGRGDLRPYGVVQFYPMLALPLLCWLFPAHRVIGGRHAAAMFACYAVAKLFEHFDAAVMEALGGAMSGHALKHVTAAGTPAVLVRVIARLPRG